MKIGERITAVGAPPLILHVFATFRVGGPQVRFADITRALGGRFRHIVVAMDGGYDCAARIDPEIAVSYWRDFVPPPSLVKTLLSVRRLLRRHRPDLLVTYNWGAIEWALADRLPICPQIHIADGFGPEEANGQLWRRVVTRRLAFGPGSRLVVPSLTLKRLALDVWRIPAKRVVYIPNGIDPGRFTPAPSAAAAQAARQRLGLPLDRPIIGTLAALRPEKNLGRLIRAFAAARREVSAHLVIAGDGPERGRLEALVREQDLAGDVTFLGPVPVPETVYPAFDVFALSSDTEQMPYAVLEAMACGLPIAGVDVGDVKAMVAEPNRALIAPPADAPLAQALAQALVQALDEAGEGPIGALNRARVIAEYEIGRMCDAYETLFTSAAHIIGSPSRH